MKIKNIEDIGCIKSYPKCIQWVYGDIDILGIKNGDYLDSIIFNIAKKICDLSEPYDLSTLSLQCLVDKLNITEPTNKTIQTILQLLIDNDCKLKDLIDNLQQIINNNNSTLTLNLKCLTDYDSLGNSLPYDLKTVLQKLINEACSTKTSITYLNSKVVDLQNQINNLNLNPYTEPLITSCLFSNKPLSQALITLSGDYCTYKTKIGTISQINTAVGKQCTTISQLFATDPNFVQNPSTLAQLDNNQWIAICNALERLAVIEQTCCAPGCDKIKIGFTYSYDYDTLELTLSFTSGAGTFIPSGFVDCGTEFTFKDCDGNIVLTSIQPIVAAGDLIFTLPSGVCLDKLTVSIKTKFCLKDNNNNVILTCQDCITKEILIQSECCTLCNESTTDNVVISYTVPTTI